ARLAPLAARQHDVDLLGWMTMVGVLRARRHEAYADPDIMRDLEPLRAGDSRVSVAFGNGSPCVSASGRICQVSLGSMAAKASAKARTGPSSWRACPRAAGKWRQTSNRAARGGLGQRHP